MRANELEHDPFRQVDAGINQLVDTGHTPSKVELVIIGGTFLAYPEEYQEEFVKRSFDALNGVDSATVDEAHLHNELASKRCVGLTFETKPEYCLQPHVDRMLHFGGTRVEIGVQALRDEVYQTVNRGHTLQDVKDSFRIARDSGFKIVAHMMPGLPGSTLESDLEDFTHLFQDAEYKPDMLKIYPTLVLPATGLEKLYRMNRYIPYDDSELLDLLVRVKQMVPRWVRIMRIQREIPAQSIVNGVKRGNLRELVKEEMKQRGVICKCIRCREVGLNKNRSIATADPRFIRISSEGYEASGGREVFLSAELPELLLGFLRLRTPSERAHRPELQGQTAIVRELHVYGNLVPVGDKSEADWQHRGIGTELMINAEREAEAQGASKIAVISAVGTRNYYRRLGYSRDGPYMSKRFR
jgi:elongator complex protein 3